MKIQITAGILAGGKSSRMGTNKMNLIWHQQTFLEHMIDNFNDFEQVLVSVASKEQYPDLKAHVVCDEKQGYGPLEGIYQLLIHAKYEWVFIAAADMPLMSKQLVQAILDVPRDNMQAIIITEGEKVHPLCGLYHRTVISSLEEMFTQEKHSLMGLLDKLQVRYVDVDELQIKRVELTNINTKQEYEKILGG